MDPVSLYTTDGGFVVRGWVPPFLVGKEADVLLWGDRVFALARDHNGTARRQASGDLKYVEVFAVALCLGLEK